MKSIESSPALPIPHKVNPKGVKGGVFWFFSPSKEMKEERRKGTRKERRKTPADYFFVCVRGRNLLLKYSFGTHFHFYMMHFIHQQHQQKFKGDNFEKFDAFLKVSA